jgi:cell division protein FtsI (penicillin-binding protein 3)
MAALMEIDSGAIVALANIPTFDPNSFWESSPESLPNRVVSERIKPGPLNRLFMLAADIRDGRVSWEEPTESKPFHGKEPQPRITKKRVNAPLPMQWHCFAADLLGSPELADFDSDISADGLAALAVSLGFDKDRQLDLAPARIKGINEEDADKDRGSYLFADDNRVTSLSLLTGFTWLVNGGHQVKPYLLQETITNDGKRESLSHPYGPLAGFTGEMSQQFVSFLADKVKPGRKFYIAEALALEQGEISSLSPEKEELGKAEAEAPLFQTILLGMGPVADPRLSLIVVLDGAKVDLASYPPGQRMFNKLMARSVSLLNSAEVKDGNLPPQLDNEEIYHRWMAGRTDPDSVGNEVTRSLDRMPDLRGYSLRKALQVLQPGKMRIIVHGAGRVRSQKPRPGAGISGDECVLTLTMKK